MRRIKIFQSLQKFNQIFIFRRLGFPGIENFHAINYARQQML